MSVPLVVNRKLSIIPCNGNHFPSFEVICDELIQDKACSIL